MEYDFDGWASRNNVRCSDGRTIMRDAFSECDGIKVPLVWQHLHDDPTNVLGHAILENRPEGVYAYGKFNDSQLAQEAKLRVENGDIDSLSIYANRLSQDDAGRVMHGMIREVSLCISGANPGARIENISLQHSDGMSTELDDEVIIYSGETIMNEQNNNLAHADKEVDENSTIKEIIDTMTPLQKDAMYAVIGQIVEDQEDDLEDEDEMAQSMYAAGYEDAVKEGGYLMHNNVFDKTSPVGRVGISKDDFEKIKNDASKIYSGSFKEAFNSYLEHNGLDPNTANVLMHAESGTGTTTTTPVTAGKPGVDYGIKDINVFYPDARAVNGNIPLVKRNTEWVNTVLNGVTHSPFSRIKSVAADLTADDARARGYLKTHKKKDEVIKAMKRVTLPTTIYKKQRLDRDDIVDITDYNVVAFMHSEMRVMLDEEAARAMLIGDGRSADSEDKINEDCIRPIMTDDPLYTIHHTVSKDPYSNPTDFIDDVVASQDGYEGSGTPLLFTSPSLVTKMLLSKDTTGRRLYNNEKDLADAMGVAGIVKVPQFAGLTRPKTVAIDGTGASGTMYVYGIIVNLKDYTSGADKGGEVNMFDDFDIDFNQYKYLMETRISGALTIPKSAISLEMTKSA